MRKFSKIALEWLGYFLIIMALLEITLRLFPALVPLKILSFMGEEVRAAIAVRRDLATKADHIPLERDDGGPFLRIRRPGITVTYPGSDYGMVEKVTMDDQGFCNPKENSYSREKIQIITVGDSFTWCTTVNPEDTWTARIGRLANKSVYNLGSPGIGVHEYLQILKQFGLEKSPELVVMAVYEGNDLRNAVAYTKYRDTVQEQDGGFSAIPCYQSRLICGIYRWFQEGFLGRKSYAFNLLMSSLRLGKVWFATTADDTAVDDSVINNFRYTIAGDKDTIKFNSGNADLDEPIHAQQLKEGVISLDAFNDALNNFAALAKEHKFIPMVIYIPSAYTAYNNYVNFEDPALKNLLTWFSGEQRKFFKEQSKKLGFAFIDTTPTFQEAATGHRKATNLLYYPTNLHLTAAGHDTIARYLYSRLQTIYP